MTVSWEAIRGDGIPFEPTAPAEAGTQERVAHADDLRLAHRRYARAVAISDAAVLAATMAIAQIGRFGSLDVPTPNAGLLTGSYMLLGAVLGVLWWSMLGMMRTRARGVLGEGAEEYRRIAKASFLVFGWFALMSMLFKYDASRGYLAIAFPAGVLLLVVVRMIARRRVQRARCSGAGLANVLVVGSSQSAERIAAWFDRHPESGYRVIGVWSPPAVGSGVTGRTAGATVSRVPNQRSVHPHTNLPLVQAITDFAVDSVVVTDSEALGHDGLRDLSWELTGTDVELMVSPNVIDVVGARIHVREVSSMPLIHVEQPTYAGANHVLKLLFDRIGAGLVLAVLSPLLMVTALAVKATSPGPVFYRQERIGLDGKRFAMIKFRSMRQGADGELFALIAAQGSNSWELPKIEDDPRITRVGRFIRRYSIDELPQLLNVLRGDMSLVGPRPQRDFEVERYDHVASRRLTVRPGMTGLWQVSGRSNLEWADAIRLDLLYVENWSIIRDLVILWRTARAVIGSDGAV